jgi:hypothetical protein
MYQVQPKHLARDLGVFLVIVGVIAAMLWWLDTPRPPVKKDWQAEDLVEHLNAKGEPVRIVPCSGLNGLDAGVYLTTTQKTWEDLIRLPAAPERIDDWKGTVYCSKAAKSTAADGALDLWGNCGQREGSILMFGDATLRDRITGVLREPDFPRPKATAVAE